MHEHQNPGEKTAESGKDHLRNFAGHLEEALSGMRAIGKGVK
jgi:hypothetical protein